MAKSCRQLSTINMLLKVLIDNCSVINAGVFLVDGASM